MSSLFDSDDDDFGPPTGVQDRQQDAESEQQALGNVAELNEEGLEDQVSDEEQVGEQQDQLDDLVDEDDFGGGMSSQQQGVELEDMQDELEDQDVMDEQLDSQPLQPQFDDFDDEDEDEMQTKDKDEPEIVDFNAEPGQLNDQQQKKQKKNLGPPMNINASLVNHPDPSKLKIIRFSQFVGVEPRVFDEENFNPMEELYTIIRWRWRADSNGGQQQKESNTKWIKWSDGSESLAIGDEVFDLQDLDISNQNMYLFARHHGLIQGVCHLKTRSSLRAVNMDIQAQKRLEQIMEAKAGSRTQKVKTVTKLKDPETQQRQMEILEQQRIKERELMQQRRQKAEMRSTGRKSGLNRQYLEEDDDGDYTGNNRSTYSRGARDAVSEARTESRLQRAKRDREEEYTEDKQPKAKRGVVLDSSDDDDF